MDVESALAVDMIPILMGLLPPQNTLDAPLHVILGSRLSGVALYPTKNNCLAQTILWEVIDRLVSSIIPPSVFFLFILCLIYYWAF